MNERLLNAYMNKGMILSKMGRDEEALESLNKTLEMAPDNIDVLRTKCELLFRLDKHEDAIDCFRKINIDEIEDAKQLDFLKKKAASQRKLNRNQGAYKTYKEILDLDDEDIKIWRDLYSLLKDSDVGAKNDLLLCYDRLLENEPENLELLKEKALLLNETERFEEALKSIVLILKKFPEDRDFWRLRYRILKELNKSDDIITAVDKILKFEPENIELWHEKLEYHEQQEDMEQVLKCFDSILKLQPEDTTLWNEKIELLKKLDRPSEALKCIEELKGIKKKHYRKVLRDAWEDGVVTDKEKRLIEELRIQTDISKAEHETMEQEIRKELNQL